MSVGKFEKLAAKQVKRPAENKYHFFVNLLDHSSKQEHPLIRKEVLESYKKGDLRKSEYLSLLREIQRREQKPKEKEKKAKVNVDVVKLDEIKLENAREVNPYFENKFKDREREDKKEEKLEGHSKGNSGFFSNILSNPNFRVGFFVIAIFVLLFVVTKNALSGRGDGELLIFAIVLMGILVIVGSSGSKKESSFF